MVSGLRAIAVDREAITPGPKPYMYIYICVCIYIYMYNIILVTSVVNPMP